MFVWMTVTAAINGDMFTSSVLRFSLQDTHVHVLLRTIRADVDASPTSSTLSLVAVAPCRRRLALHLLLNASSPWPSPCGIPFLHQLSDLRHAHGRERTVDEGDDTRDGTPIGFLDYEGENLGMKSGHLSLIAIGTPTQERAYIVNVMAIGKAGLQSILIFSNRLKCGRWSLTVAWISASFHDLVAVGGEDAEYQCGRQRSPYLHSNEAEASAALYQEVYKLVGLGQALDEHDIDADEERFTIRSIGHAETRLPLCIYSTLPTIVSRMWACFKHESYLNRDLPAQSSRYVRMWLGSAGRPEGDTYKLHALLPLPTSHITGHGVVLVVDATGILRRAASPK
ncbi:hypothetical protein B0H12DRAFT_1231076 [Mycena haematopus]|nr:hypothetical protein B0H12DRAFT_1231076 [Mycena haematopus]